jgi:hypothetical protein
MKVCGSAATGAMLALALLILAIGLMGIGYWQRARAVAARPAATDTFKG